MRSVGESAVSRTIDLSAWVRRSRRPRSSGKPMIASLLALAWGRDARPARGEDTSSLPRADDARKSGRLLEPGRRLRPALVRWTWSRSCPGQPERSRRAEGLERSGIPPVFNRNAPREHRGWTFGRPRLWGKQDPPFG